MAEHQTLTRADLCEAVHEEVGLSRQECSALVERTLELIIESLERGETVKLSGFGVFQVREKRAEAFEGRAELGVTARILIRERADRFGRAAGNG